MVERRNPVLPVSQQCRLLALPRSTVYRQPAEVSAEDLAIMALIDRQYLARPYYGSRRMAAWLATQGHVVNRKRVQRLMRLLGLVAIYQRPNTSKPAAAHKIYPYLLGGLAIDRANQVWCSDVTYIPMAKGFLYLVVPSLFERFRARCGRWVYSVQRALSFLVCFAGGLCPATCRSSTNAWVPFLQRSRFLSRPWAS